MEKIIRIDDIDQSTHDVQTVRIGLDKRDWTIDLSAQNRQRLADLLAPYIDHARPLKKTTTKTRKGARNDAETERRKAIRQWAATQEINLSPYGRIPETISAQYDQEHHHD